MYSKISITLVIFTYLLINCYATPEGAPNEACETLLPLHNDSLPRQGNPPFEIAVIPEVVNRSWLVTVRGVTSSFPFKGIILQARSADDPRRYQTFGSFSKPDPGNTDIQVITCQNLADTVTHTDNYDKNQIQVRWTKPSTGTGSILFR